MKIAVTTLALLLGLTLSTFAHAAPSSGMLLGIYAFPTSNGLRVTDTMSGYSADGRLFPGDVLRRVTADGISIYPTRNAWQIEHAKDQIGPFQPAALEIFRPGTGVIYLWVEFQPVGGVAAYSTAGPKKYEARIMTESEKPGAALLFKSGSAKPSGGAALPKPSGGGNGSASSLFGQ